MTLLDLLLERSEPPAAPLLSPDGRHWATRRQLLAGLPKPAGSSAAGSSAAGSSAAGSSAAGPSADPAAGRALVPIRPDEPLAAVRALLAAQAQRRTPLIADPGWPAAAVARLTGQRAPDGDAIVVLTSGSSGEPRAVVRRCETWQRSLAPFTAVQATGDGDLLWAPGGLSATLTLHAVWHALATGLPVLATGRWRGPRAELERWPLVEQATLVHCVPAILRAVLAAKRAGRLPRLRRAVVGGAAADGRLREQAAAAGVELIEYYGAAELSFVGVDPDGRGLRAFAGVRWRLGPDRRLWVRSPYLADGYLTAAGRQPLVRDAAGWATVGDRAAPAPGGSVRPAEPGADDERLTILGRDGAVSIGGATVRLADVERVLCAVPGVAEAACFGEPHPGLGERLIAAILAEPGAAPVPALRAAARAALPPAARPARYVLLPELPRTAGGKVARARLAHHVPSPPWSEPPAR